MAIVLSIIAISISALTLFWTIGWSIYTQRRRTRPSLIVGAWFVVPLDDGGLTDPAVDVTITNTGQVPVTIASVGFEIEGRNETFAVIKWVLQTPRSLPIPLGPGDHWTGLVAPGVMEGSLLRRYGGSAPRRIRPVASDPTGRRYAAKQWLDLT